MKRFFATAAASLALSLSCSAQYIHAKGEELIGADGKPMLIRGTNLGNWMVTEGYMWQFGGHVQSEREIEAFVNELIGPTRTQAFFRDWRENYVTRADIHFLHEIGFNTIRVPMHYRFFESDDAEGFKLLDRLVGWAREEHIALILDMHAAPGGQTGTNIDDSWGYPWLFYDQAAQQDLVTIWTRVAKRYRNEPVVLGYDLLNEAIPPYPQLERVRLNAMLEPLYKRVAKGIRSVDTHHMLVLEGAQWDNNMAIFGPPFDPNILYEWHRYKVPVPDQKTVQDYADFRAKYHVPIYLGESGENTDEWVGQMRAIVEKNNMGFTFWPYKKIGNTAGIVKITPPKDWDAIVAYSKIPDGVGLTSDRLKSRPSQDVIDRAFAELSQNIRLANCTANLGYIRALMPQTTVDADSVKH